MAVVGPRPERPELIELIKQQVPFYEVRHLVKPGITGWAQINFRYGNSVDDSMVKLRYDLEYVKRQSLWLDLIVIIRTPVVMISKIGY
jgi:lipopolysaccharide/colanic/teichoic acid biosynthesis glycosyltransferase